MDDPVAVWRSHNYFHPFFVRFVTLLFHLEAALWSFQGNNIVFSVAIGAALAKRLNGDDHLVYVLMGDGEQQEGQVWEAATFAAHHNLDNLIATIDYNGQQIDGPVDEVMSLKNLKAQWEAFGWKVLESQGNNLEKLLETMQEAKALAKKGKPVMNLMHTEMGYGVDFMANSHKWHGIAPSDEQLASALEQLEETLGDY